MRESICEESTCTGCGLCTNVCPKGAIQMRPKGSLGHILPVIDKEKCVDCGLCSKRCPVNQLFSPVLPRTCFAGWCENKDISSGSSSGGIAAALSAHAVKSGYYVTGTVLTDDLAARMYLTASEADLKKFRGSKYIQAECGNVYRQAKELLASGGKVVFIGMPCQCAAMRSMMNGSHADQLITVELICHGVPSQKLFEDYVKSISLRKKKTVTEVSFRSDYGVELTLRQGEKIIWKHTGQEDDYLVAFQKGMIHRESCFMCQYARPERAADITIGDFWGVDESVRSRRLDSNMISVILENTVRGANFLAECPELHLEERRYEEALAGNPNLNHSSTVHPLRKEFIELYSKEGITSAFQGTIGPELKKKRLINKVKKTAKHTIKQMLHM